MIKIIVASTNPAKVEPTRQAFNSMFPDRATIVEGVSVDSGVNAQPTTDAETLQGAINRVDTIQNQYPDADYWVGIEGGIEPREDGQLGAFAWAVVRSHSQTSRGRTGEFYLPSAIKVLIDQGKTLGEADDIVFERIGSSKTNGAVGLLTGDNITRGDFHKSAVTLALIAHRFPELYLAN